MRYKRFLCLVFLLFFLSSCSLSAYADNRDVTVYIASGSKSAYRYHRTASCSSLSRSIVREITLEEAAQHGFTSCEKCNPPVPDFAVTVPTRPPSASGGNGSSQAALSPSVPYMTASPSIPSYAGSSSSSSSSSYSSGRYSPRTAKNTSQSDSIVLRNLLICYGLMILFVILGFSSLLKERPRTAKAEKPRPPVAAPEETRKREEALLREHAEIEERLRQLEEAKFQEDAKRRNARVKTEEASPPHPRMPESCFVGEDGLPASREGSERWGSGYTFYMSSGGRAYHAKGCKIGDRTLLYPVNAYTAKTGYRYYNEPHYFRPCKYCNPELPDLTWYEEYKKTLHKSVSRSSQGQGL